MSAAEVLRFKKTRVSLGVFAMCLLLGHSAFADAAKGAVGVHNANLPATAQQDPWEEDAFFVFDDNPSQSFRQMRQALNQMLDWSEQTAGQNGAMFNPGGRGFSPALDVVERPDQYLLKLDLPGMEKDKLDIRVTEQNLSISGERKSETRDRGEKGFKRFERSYGYFQRNIPIPENVKTDEVIAKYDKGVLEVVMPKRTPTPVQEPEGRKVVIA